MLTYHKNKIFLLGVVSNKLNLSLLLLIASLFSVFPHSEASNKCTDISIQVLGAGGPEINDGLASSSFLVWIKGKAKIMVDAGGGSSFQFEKSGANFNDLDAILLTHLHVDHSAALPVYIKAGYFSNRDRSLPIFGPSSGSGFPSTTDFVTAFFSNDQLSVYPYLSDNLTQQPSTDFLIKPSNINPNNKVWKKRLISTVSKPLFISAINVNHSFIPAIAWRVDYDNCSVTFSGDMNGSSGNLEVLAQSTNILVANNAIPENAHPVAKQLHMVPSTISKIAIKSNAKKILLTHFMKRSINKKQQSISIIKKEYKGKVELAKELDFVHFNE